MNQKVQDEISESDDDASEGYDSDDAGGSAGDNMEDEAPNRSEEVDGDDEYGGDGDEEDYDDEEYYEDDGDELDDAAGAGRRGSGEGKYESFNAPSVNNSFLENSMDESQQKSSSHYLRDLPSNPKKSNQVLVHYHPQLGDTGYESTLIEQTAAPPEHSYSRISRAMNVATTRRELDRPPKHIYPTSRGMHARMIDDVRVEEEMNYSPNKGRARLSGASNAYDMSEEGNDEYNNAATRQIRRRVFRVAMERGIRYERRKKLLDADADVGGPSQRVNYETNNYANRSGNGYERSAPTPIYSPADDDDEGDMPLTPGRLTTPKTISDEHSIGQVTSTESLRSYVSQAPPSPPSYPPSYKTLVYNLISANEPDKLVQIDRVMEKYAGREEELIKKLDMRYRRQRIKNNLIKSEVPGASREESKLSSKDESSEMPHQPVLNRKASMLDDGVAPMIIQTVVMTPPKKLTFVKVDPPPKLVRPEGENVDVIVSDGGRGEEKEFAQDEIMIQPKIMSQSKLSRAISESTRTQIHTNANADMDDDENSGMIPITPKMTNVEDLGNQVVNERLQRERDELLSNNNKRAEAQEDPNVPEKSSKLISPKLDTISGDSLSLPEPYRLTKQLSYGDGISVITMETKSTLQNRMASGGGEREALFSFDDMKRPPSSITVESAGSGSKGEENNAVGKTLIAPQFTKLQKVIPEIETEDEKARVAKASLETSFILDNVEARIQARQKLREEEEVAKLNEAETDDHAESELGAPIKADDELNEIESLFQEAKGISPSTDIDTAQERGSEYEQSLEFADMEVIEDEKNEGVACVDQPIIESIMSSFDDDDREHQVDIETTGPPEHQATERRESELQSIALSSANHNEEARLSVPYSAETSSTYGGGGESIVSVLSNYSIAQKAIAEAARAELQRQKEMAEYTERRQKFATSDASSAFTSDNLEEEVARLIAEKESRLQAERAVALMRAQKELEAERKARMEAEAARLKVEEELERLKLKEISMVHEAPSAQESESMPVQELAERSTPAATLDLSEEQNDLCPPDHLVDQICEPSHLEVEQDLPLSEENSQHTDDDYSEFERMISGAKAGKVTIGDEMERLGLGETAVGTEVVEDMKCIPDEEVQREQLHQEAVEKARMEAEASRLRAEQELERLRGERLSMELDETAGESRIVQDSARNEPDFLRMSSEQPEDDVEIFRQTYSSVDESQPTPVEAENDKAIAENDDLDIHLVSQSESNERGGIISVEPQSTFDSLEPDEQALHQRASEEESDQHNIPMHPAPEIAQADVLCDNAVPTNEHDVSSRAIDVSQSVHQESKPVISMDSPHMPVEVHDEEEAIIHHVARVTFEGNPSKGQLSFTTGSKIEAHSNQLGPWWLGRCGGRTGWFPASAIVPESEFLANVIGPLSGSDEPDASESVAALSGDELNAVYDLIRNPSDPLSQDEDEGDSDDESGSPAKSRWLDTENSKINSAALPSRDHSPPPTRLDPSAMAGLSERLYEPHDDDLHPNKDKETSQIPLSENIVGDSELSSEDIGDTPSKEEMACVETAKVSRNDTSDVVQPQPVVTEKSDACTLDEQPKADVTKPRPKPKPEWRATKDPKSGFIYYYHTGTRETTWEKPEGFVPKVASPTRPASTVSSKDKHSSRRKGIMGFISKIAKGTNIISSEKASGKSTSTEVDSRDKDKVNAEVRTQTTDASELKPSAITEALRNGVFSDDDKLSASDDESEMSRMSEITDTTLFSKQKIKATVGKWAEKVSDKLNSPPAPEYESLNDDATQPQDVTAVNQSEDKGVVAEGNQSREKLTTNQNRYNIDTSNDAVNSEKPQWRSAIDVATGRTYYYIRGTSKVTWEKPAEFEQ